MIRLSRLFPALLAAALIAPLSASAQYASVGDLPTPGAAAKKPKAKPPAPKPLAARAAPKTDRKPGELEGWDGAGLPPAPKPKNLPKDAVSAKPIQADGGLPLPNSITNRDSSPVGFDSKGNMGSNFKF